MRISFPDVLALPLGTVVYGLAPIGIRWTATVSRRQDGRRYLKPAKGCPVGEFAPCTVYQGGIAYDVE